MPHPRHRGDWAATQHIGLQLAEAVAGDRHHEDAGPPAAGFLTALETAGASGQLEGLLVELPHFDAGQLLVSLTMQTSCGRHSTEKMRGDVIQHIRDLLQNSPSQIEVRATFRSSTRAAAEYSAC
ncbi:MAG: hypothetical protein ABSA31_04520 [Acidimicrobiales bacterium]|jgi:hypothetical protein